jgi:hypothetical protein
MYPIYYVNSTTYSNQQLLKVKILAEHFSYSTVSIDISTSLTMTPRLVAGRWLLASRRHLLQIDCCALLTSCEIRTEQGTRYVKAQPLRLYRWELKWQYGWSILQLSGTLKKRLDGNRFATNPDMKQAVTSCLQTLRTGYFRATFPLTVVFNGRSGVYHLLPMCHVYTLKSE